MKYWAVSGLTSPRFLPQLLSSLKNLDADPLIVETGEGVGVFPVRGSAISCETRGVVPFLQRAFQELEKRASPGDWFLRIDADDFYGRGYQASVDEGLAQGVVASWIRDVFVKTEDAKLYYCEGRGIGVPGGTLAGQIDLAPPFRATGKPWGEDDLWSREANISHRPGKGYAMVRHQDHKHTWPIGGHELPHVWFCNARFLGEWDSRIVEGLSPIPEGIPFSADPQIVTRAAGRIITSSGL